MSAKHPRKASRAAEAAASSPAPAAVPATAAPASDATTATAPAGFTPWIDSTDPRKRLLGKVVLAGVWIYVGALWLLALDQTFNWGIFGPKVPPVP